MLKAIVIISSLFTLTACASFEKLPASYEWQGVPALATVQQSAPSYFKGILKDPASASYKYGTPFKAHVNDGGLYGDKINWIGWVYPVHINAKNSYGGYTGYQTYYTQFTGDRLVAHITKADWDLYSGTGVVNRD